MTLSEKLQEIRQSDVIVRINGFINSKYMLALLAIFTLFSNVFSLELWLYAFVGAVGLYICLFGKDMLFLAPAFIFMYISPSKKNNPFNWDTAIYHQLGVQLFFIITISVFVLLFVFRIATDYGFMSVLKKKRKLSLGLLLLTAAFFLGGLGYSQYDPQNIVYCAVLFVCFFLLYFILTGTVQWRDVSKDYWAWLGLFVGFTVVLQLVNVYLVNDVLRDGEIFRGNIYTGWGQYPPMAAVLLLCLPCPFYLAATKKLGFIFNLLGCGIFLAIVATTSRAAMLFGALILAACAIVTLFVKKNRIQNAIVYGVLAVGVLVVAACFWSEIKKIFTALIELGLHDNGRGELYTEALQRFICSPLFGQGFFACSPDRWQYNPGEFNLLPYFWHNTLIQMLATSGIIGLTAYLFHRLQTLLLIVQKPNLAKIFIGLSVLGMLLVCLLDCHIFNVGVTFIYTVFLTFAEATEEMENSQNCE